MVYTAFIDLDDTLLDKEKRISDFTFGALQEFQMRGNHIVFATARSKQLHGLQARIKTITPHFRGRDCQRRKNALSGLLQHRRNRKDRPAFIGKFDQGCRDS